MIFSKINQGIGIIDLDELKPEALNIFSFEIAISRPLVIKGNLLSFRRGIIIEMITSEGARSFGEISPLPGFSSESFEDAAYQIKNIRGMILNRDNKIRQKPYVFTAGLLPSVRSGLEMAAFNLSCQENLKKNINSTQMQKNGAAGNYLPVNGLISFSTKAKKEEIKLEAERILKEGYSTVKIKVGRQSPDNDVSMVTGLCKYFNGKKSLRLDANSSWDLDEAEYFGRKISENGVKDIIEYIEDPLKNIDGLKKFFENTGIPIALDERIDEFEMRYGRLALNKSKNNINENIEKINEGVFPFLKAIIIKPAAVGGFNRASELIGYCSSSGLLPVLSSTFETGLGISSIVLFAKTHGLLGIAAGLDTLGWFESDIINRRLSIKDGGYSISDAGRALTDINFSKLTLIS